MLLELMRECHNFFDISEEQGNFTIQDSIININKNYLIGQYILVTGSILNDGVYLLNDKLYTLVNSVDEEFNGIVYGLRIPKDFIKLSEEIEKFIADNPTTNITRESFGNYSSSKAQGKNGIITWQEQFASRLNPYRRMFHNIRI